MRTPKSSSACYIFAESLNDEAALCLILDAEGKVHEPPQFKLYPDIQQLQSQTSIMVVVSTKHFSLHWATLPPLPEKKLEMAIPYAIEEQLAEPLHDLHFAFDRQHYINGRYLVAVCNKHWLEQFILRLENHHVHFDCMTLDWFALSNHEALRLDDHMLVHDNETFCGSLASSMANFYLKEISSDIKILPEAEPFVYPLWIAQRLHVQNFINILQGKNSTHFNKTRKWYQAAAAMALVFLCTALVTSGLKIHALNQIITQTDAKIAVIYKQFFPGAKQIISPRFRISQLLKQGAGQNENSFWILLNRLSEATDLNMTDIKQIRFQKQHLQITLTARTFKGLEALQNKLQQKSVKVKQLQASSVGNEVSGTLELSL